MSRRVLWIVASLGVLATIAWWWPRATPPLPPPVTAPSAPVSERAADPASRPDARSDGFPFETLLLPHEEHGARPDSVRIGIGRVAPDQARAYERWVRSGEEGAGPREYSDLAEVGEWRTPVTTTRDDGTVVVGPMQLQWADRFDLRAQGTNPLISYSASFTAQSHPGTVAPTLAAGLTVSRASPAGAEAGLLLRRVDTAEDAARWQALMAEQAPDLLAAFDEAALPLQAITKFAPLPPGPLDIVLQINGVEAERQRVTLIAGQWTDIRFDEVSQVVAQAVAADLELTFVVAGTTDPVEGITATWHAERGDDARVSDAAGQVTFANIDRQRLQRFTLQFPTRSSELPIWPETRPIELTPDGDAEPSADRTVIRRTIEVTPLRWLDVRTGDFPIPFHRQGGNPYPIFVLQQEQDGRWLDVASDHFLPIRGGLAVSVEDDGRYRVMALRTPWAVRYSSNASVAPGGESRLRVDLLPSTGHRVELTVLRDGVPLANAPISLRGPARALPGMTVTSDGAGRLMLDEATVNEIRLEVPGYQAERVDLESSASRVELSLDAEASSRD